MSIIYEWDEFPSCITYAGIDLLIELKELVKEKQLIRDWMESKRLEWRNQNNGTNGIYEIDGASTTDGGIDIHWADLSDKIDGTYENNRI